MPVKEILQLGHPVLWQISSPVVNPSSPDIVPLIEDLGDTLAGFRFRNGFGRGIAAPQIGILKRVIYVRMESSGIDCPFINPEILWRSGDSVDCWDDCFSFPELMVKVARSRNIRVRYFSPDGAERTIEAADALSELFQHEIDHLDGILATDRAKTCRDFMTRHEFIRLTSP